ncbi:hypothetical protein PISL3812_05165 [Talaromyces islandicus]|uniref:Sulphur transport domain-containing protein n=1 Tax=Talaromyces islandicus TaxID=28573 RepID=A0A0U1LXP3_TALIS|nr:hypothetical protein PISL3812_05165 [Talaromyces islandicus]
MFTPIHTSLGALLLFSGSFGLLVHNGRVFGISPILRSGLRWAPQRRLEDLLILGGLLSSPLLVWFIVPSLLPSFTGSPSSWSSAASTLGLGFLTGWGTKNGHGCTSGHMLCGLSRLSPRSLIATALFFTTALLTANFAPSLTGSQIIPACDHGRPCYETALPTASELAVMTTCAVLALLTNFVVLPMGSGSTRSSETASSESQRLLFAYLAGLQFGLGLLFSGMAEPTKVIRFFAFLANVNNFDPSLALVLLFGVGPSLYGYLAVRPGQPTGDGKVDAPTLADAWHLPTRTVADIDWRQAPYHHSFYLDDFCLRQPPLSLNGRFLTLPSPSQTFSTYFISLTRHLASTWISAGHHPVASSASDDPLSEDLANVLESKLNDRERQQLINEIAAFVEPGDSDHGRRTVKGYFSREPAIPRAVLQPV